MAAELPPKPLVYVSEKTGMLYGHLAAESRGGGDASMSDKASAVARYLAKDPALLGTVDAPRAYFRGELDMHTSHLSPFGDDVIAMGGATTKTFVALVGRASQRLAEIPPYSDIGLGVQLYIYFVQCARLLKDESWSAESWRDSLVDGESPLPLHGVCRLYFKHFSRAWDASPTRKVEFVARALDRQEEQGHVYLVGSPLCIAAVDD